MLAAETFDSPTLDQSPTSDTPQEFPRRLLGETGEWVSMLGLGMLGLFVASRRRASK